MNDMNIVNLAAEAGKIMLENGGETYRVEQTISMICSSYNVKTSESFVSPTVIMTSITNNRDECNTVIKRITSRTTDLQKISMINDLSRRIQKNPMSPQDLSFELNYINSYPTYSTFVKTFFAGITTSAFTLLFGGSFGDFAVAFFTGIIINLICSFLSHFDVNSFFINVSGGSVAAFMGLFFANISPIFHEDKIIIGSIMLLVPGLLITNAIRDTIAGDLLSGLSRSLEAILIAGAIAIGAGFVFKVWISILGGV